MRGLGLGRDILGNFHGPLVRCWGERGRSPSLQRARVCVVFDNVGVCVLQLLIFGFIDVGRRQFGAPFTGMGSVGLFGFEREMFGQVL